MIRETLLPTEQDVRHFEARGYWISDRLFGDEDLRRFNEAFDRVLEGRYETGQEPWSRSWSPGDGPRGLCKIDNAHWADRTLRELVLDETVGAIAARLIGATEVRLWQDQLLDKPGLGQESTQTANVGWHQDRNYWKCCCPEMLTAWVALVDVTAGGGAMQFVPCSHLWGEVRGDFFAQDLDAVRRAVERKTGREFQTVPIELRAGQVSFHHCLLLHGSGPNLTGQPRRSVAIHLMPEWARYTAGTENDDHMNATLLRLLGRSDGDPFAGAYWPRLHPGQPLDSEITVGPSHRELMERSVES